MSFFGPAPHKVAGVSVARTVEHNVYFCVQNVWLQAFSVIV